MKDLKKVLDNTDNSREYKLAIKAKIHKDLGLCFYCSMYGGCNFPRHKKVWRPIKNWKKHRLIQWKEKPV